MHLLKSGDRLQVNAGRDAGCVTSRLTRDFRKFNLQGKYWSRVLPLTSKLAARTARHLNTANAIWRVRFVLFDSKRWAFVFICWFSFVFSYLFEWCARCLRSFCSWLGCIGFSIIIKEPIFFIMQTFLTKNKFFLTNLPLMELFP